MADVGRSSPKWPLVVASLAVPLSACAWSVSLIVNGARLGTIIGGLSALMLGVAIWSTRWNGPQPNQKVLWLSIAWHAAIGTYLVIGSVIP
jgi:hypothetical protein